MTVQCYVPRLIFGGKGILILVGLVETSIFGRAMKFW